MTNCEPINSPILESVRTGRRSNSTKLLARWQSGYPVMHFKSFVLNSRLPFQTHLLCSIP
jgi:hypothetical protein